MALCALPAAAQTARPQAVSAISVCTASGLAASNSCPSGSYDTHQIVLAPDNTGSAINLYAGGAISDEHSSVFSPGTLGTNGDYLFFVAAGNKLNVDIGALVLSGGTGPGANGQWTLDYSKADLYGGYPTGFGDVFLAPTAQGKCPVVADGDPAHQDQTFDLGYAAPGSVVKDPTAAPGSLFMIYEGVNTCIGDNGGAKTGNGNAYISAGVATSLDYGKTWPTYRGTAAFTFVPLPNSNKTQGPNAPSGALGQAVCTGTNCNTTPPATYGRYPALSPPISLATAMATGQPLPSTMADSEPSAFVDDAAAIASPYVYLVHGYIPGGLGDPPIPDGRNSDLALARAQVNGGTAPLQFLKWNGQAYASPGIGGAESPILPDGAFQNCAALTQSRSQGSIYYVEPTQQYLLLFVCGSPRDPAGSSANRGSAWFFSTAYDLGNPAQWTPPQEVAGSWGDWDTSGGCPAYKGWYPTAMSLGAKPGHLTSSGYIFYMWGCLGGSSLGAPPQRQYSSRSFQMRIGPLISLVANAEGESPAIAPNTWVEIKGAALTQGDTYTWQASDLVNGNLPTQLHGVSATVNGNPAYVSYISPTQINILTPPNPLTGPVPVAVTTNGATAAAYTAQAQPLSPSLFVFGGGPYVAAVHADGSYLGPASLYPGLTTPAAPGEEVMLYANGFGPTSVPVIGGSAMQSGTLEALPSISIGGVPAV
ncbi:MAG TPA: IPT/TIG domain-containing protein, partial [Candidatus Sulfopaludibacter sp.]|nr:IPT/TIG domain-containing protein [Candidatus Sulfopaludibacter sp.]